jgi:transposase
MVLDRAIDNEGTPALWWVNGRKGFASFWALRTDVGYHPDMTKLMSRPNGCKAPKAYLYRSRNLVEWFFSRIKHFRPVATRYGKLAANLDPARLSAAVASRW